YAAPSPRRCDVATKRKVTKEEASRNDQVVRIVKLIRELTQGEEDLATLAERHDVNPRTIRRDLEAIEQVGIEVQKDKRDDGTPIWFIDDEVDALNGLDQSHFVALVAAMREGGPLAREGELLHKLEDLADRVKKALGPQGTKTFAALNKCFFSWDRFAMRKAPRDVLGRLIDAIDGQKKCIVKYRAPSAGNTEKTYPVLPLRLLAHNGALYLHAYSPKFKTVLALNLHRLASLQVTDEVLPVPAGVDGDTLARAAFGIFLGKDEVEYELDFDAFSRPYIEEREWHPTQRLEPLEGGGVKLTFRCTPSYEVTNWVATWRQHVEVVKPAALQDELGEFGQWLRAKYPVAKKPKAASA
ncbi:MAG TPA: transcriptional regulator, partial [Archangium sp.]